MTLIAAWRCHQAVVFCADAQETISGYRVSVQKIAPQAMKNFEVIVAGSGHSGLIESFILMLNRNVCGRQFQGLDGFLAVAEETLAEFYSHDVSVCPDAEKAIRLLIAAVSKKKKTPQYDAWLVQNIRLQRIANFEITGMEEPLYKTIAARLYSQPFSVDDAIKTGVYLFGLAKETSNYIGGPTSIAIVNASGITMKDEKSVRALEDRLASAQKTIDRDLFHSIDKALSG